MRLKTIKSKASDTHYSIYVFKEMDLIKEHCKSCETMFFLGYFYFGQVFLSKNKIYVANYDIQCKENTPVADTMTLSELYEITLLKDYPKSEKDLSVKTIISSEKSKFSVDKFLFWVDAPCDINQEIDAPYYEIIKFLNNYSKNTFSTSRYEFYSKRDNDLNFINKFYVFDKKTGKKVKLYAVDNWSDAENTWQPPQRLEDIGVDDLGQNISEYQKLKIKKEFLKLANEQNQEFNIQNYWVMDLLVHTIQPVLVLHEWSCHRCFCRPNLFGHIWVYDFPSKDEDPSFFITDENFIKVATLKFKTPEYLFKGIYKRGMAKAKSWKLNKSEINDLIRFFNEPSTRANNYGSGILYDGYSKYVKTNWQQLIFEYNHNSAGWGWGDTEFDIPPECDTNRFSNIDALPFDLPIPDYTKLR